MRLYEVTYKKYSSDVDTYTTRVVASDPTRAFALVNKPRAKFCGYSGRVVAITETIPTVYIAK